MSENLITKFIFKKDFIFIRVMSLGLIEALAYLFSHFKTTINSDKVVLFYFSLVLFRGENFQGK